MIDTFYSGGLSPGAWAGEDSLPDIDRLANELADAETGVVVYSSSTGKETSLEDEAWGHGAFTDYVTEKLIGDTRDEKFGLGDPLEPAELLEELIGGLRALWQKYRSVQDDRRETLRQQLDALKWREFHELTGDQASAPPVLQVAGVVHSYSPEVESGSLLASSIGRSC